MHLLQYNIYELINECLFRHKNNVKRSLLCKKKYKNNKIHKKKINQLKIIKLIFTNL